VRLTLERLVEGVCVCVCVCVIAISYDCVFQGIVVTIDKKVDDNWYSGAFEDKKGIFPVAYVQLIEG